MPRGAHSEVDIPQAVVLADLPERRRPAVARLLAKGRVAASCRWRGRSPQEGIVGARLGSDGRYHLTKNEHPACDNGRKTVRHRQRAYWWSDGHQYRVQPPPGPDVGDCDSRAVSWQVTLEGPVLDPAEIPPRVRCPINLPLWPGHNGGRLAKTRRQLVDELGPLCSICKGAYAVVIDHDHQSGIVRGYLCRWCNGQVDRCIHLSGCAYGDYLNRPPAWHLGLAYPVSSRRFSDPSEEIAWMLRHPDEVLLLSRGAGRD